MCLDWKFHSVRSYYCCTYFRLCQMSDDVECLEVVTELVVLADRDCEEHAVIFTSVEGCRYRIDVKFLA